MLIFNIQPIERMAQVRLPPSPSQTPRPPTPQRFTKEFQERLATQQRNEAIRQEQEAKYQSELQKINRRNELITRYNEGTIRFDEWKELTGNDSKEAYYYFIAPRNAKIGDEVASELWPGGWGPSFTSQKGIYAPKQIPQILPEYLQDEKGAPLAKDEYSVFPASFLPTSTTSQEKWTSNINDKQPINYSPIKDSWKASDLLNTPEQTRFSKIEYSPNVATVQKESPPQRLPYSRDPRVIRDEFGVAIPLPKKADFSFPDIVEYAPRLAGASFGYASNVMDNKIVAPLGELAGEYALRPYAQLTLSKYPGVYEYNKKEIDVASRQIGAQGALISQYFVSTPYTLFRTGLTGAGEAYKGNWVGVGASLAGGVAYYGGLKAASFGFTKLDSAISGIVRPITYASGYAYNASGRFAPAIVGNVITKAKSGIALGAQATSYGIVGLGVGTFAYRGYQVAEEAFKKVPEQEIRLKSIEYSRDVAFGVVGYSAAEKTQAFVQPTLSNLIYGRGRSTLDELPFTASDVLSGKTNYPKDTLNARAFRDVVLKRGKQPYFQEKLEPYPWGGNVTPYRLPPKFNPKPKPTDGTGSEFGGLFLRPSGASFSFGIPKGTGDISYKRFGAPSLLGGEGPPTLNITYSKGYKIIQVRGPSDDVTLQRVGARFRDYFLIPAMGKNRTKPESEALLATATFLKTSNQRYKLFETTLSQRRGRLKTYFEVNEYKVIGLDKPDALPKPKPPKSQAVNLSTVKTPKLPESKIVSVAAPKIKPDKVIRNKTTFGIYRSYVESIYSSTKAATESYAAQVKRLGEVTGNLNAYNKATAQLQSLEKIKTEFDLTATVRNFPRETKKFDEGFSSIFGRRKNESIPIQMRPTTPSKPKASSFNPARYRTPLSDTDTKSIISRADLAAREARAEQAANSRYFPVGPIFASSSSKARESSITAPSRESYSSREIIGYYSRPSSSRRPSRSPRPYRGSSYGRSENPPPYYYYGEEPTREDSYLPRQSYSPRSPPRYPPYRPPSRPPRSRDESFKGFTSKKTRGEGAFFVQTRRKGKLLTIKTPLTKSDAFAYGTNLVERTARASFRIVEAPGIAFPRGIPSTRLPLYQNRKGFFVEPAKFRLNKPSERLEVGRNKKKRGGLF